MKVVDRIIKSIIDTDLYKFTMMQVALLLFPNLKVKYRFIDRNNIIFPKGFAQKLNEQIRMMADLKLTPDEKKFLLNKCKFLTKAYVDFLAGYSFDPLEVTATQDKEGHLIIDIEGYWYRTILWEVPLMAMISELYFKETDQEVDIYSPELKKKNIDKVRLFEKHNAYFGDMGSRRRYSLENHLNIIKTFKENANHTFVGTSNVYMAYLFDLKPIGTLAHEMVMVHAALYGYKLANKMTMDSWIKVYNGDLGTMLPDTFTAEVFFKTFDTMYAKLFDSLRHDSGDPFEFVDKVVAHYIELGIDPTEKTIIFSDGLNPKLACELKEYCVGKIKSSFGLGTNFTNDVGVKPLNMVIKISHVWVNGEWVHAVKLSDNPIKHTGDEYEVKLCKSILNIIRYKFVS